MPEERERIGGTSQLLMLYKEFQTHPQLVPYVQLVWMMESGSDTDSSPMQPKRKSQRKHGYDYSQPGYYAAGNGRAQRPSPTTLSDVIKRFKTLTTKRYVDGVRAHGWHSFSGKLWQRSYHDRIIRNETELNKIRTYICNNPNEWDTDENNNEIQDRTCPCNETSLTGRS